MTNNSWSSLFVVIQIIKKDRFCAETSNVSADSTLCTASEQYDVFTPKDAVQHYQTILGKIDGFRVEASNGSNDNTLCMAGRYDAFGVKGEIKQY